MFAKIFRSMFEGSLRGKSDALLVFINLLVYCDQHGQCDRSARTIADETGLSLDRVQSAIDFLSAPDQHSRRREHGGRRLLPIDADRNWGWQIVNYLHYRGIRTAADKNAAARPTAARSLQLDDNWIAGQKKILEPYGVEIDAEITKATVWLAAHPPRRMSKPFMARWLSKCIEDRQAARELAAAQNFSGAKKTETKIKNI